MRGQTLFFAGVLGLLSACGSSTPSLPGPGYDMQIRVDGATLHEGPLVTVPDGPKVSQLLRSQTDVQRGEWGVKLSGRIDPGAVAVYIAAQGDPRHWVVPAKGFDFTFPKELQWSANLSFAPTIGPEKKLRVNVQAIDAQGNKGPIRYIDFGLTPVPPPAPLVVSLDWNRPVDFDLILITPDGHRLGPKNRSDAQGTGTKPRAVFAYDSNQECRIDARNHEDVVWRMPPLPGHYLVYVDLFSNCKEPAANYQVHVSKDGVPWLKQTGVQYAVDASWPDDPDGPPGELVLEFDLP